MEYATREQAQTAVTTLSNQNLMGRLVYVREVRPSRRNILFDNMLRMDNRTGRPSHALSDQPEVAAALVVVVACKVVMEAVATTMVAWEAWAAVIASSISLTFVHPPLCRQPLYISVQTLTVFTASLHRGLARFKGLVPPSRFARPPSSLLTEIFP